MSDRRRKVFFEVSQDEDGYPPVAAESLWAIPTDNVDEYILDNVPFFESVATLGETVRVEEREGRLWFCETVKETRHSLIRVVRLDGQDPASIGKELERLGCTWELDGPHRLIAVDVPYAQLAVVQALLIELEKSGVIDYEEAVLRSHA